MVMFAAEINVVYPMSDEVEIAKRGQCAGRELYGFIYRGSRCCWFLAGYSTKTSSIPSKYSDLAVTKRQQTLGSRAKVTLCRLAHGISPSYVVD